MARCPWTRLPPLMHRLRLQSCSAQLWKCKSQQRRLVRRRRHQLLSLFWYHSKQSQSCRTLSQPASISNALLQRWRWHHQHPQRWWRVRAKKTLARCAPHHHLRHRLVLLLLLLLLCRGSIIRTPWTERMQQLLLLQTLLLPIRRRHPAHLVVMRGVVLLLLQTLLPDTQRTPHLQQRLVVLTRLMRRKSSRWQIEVVQTRWS